MTFTEPTLPHWDMTVLYPGLDSPEFAAGFAAVIQAIAELAALFDQRVRPLHPDMALDAATVAVFDEVTTRYNDVFDQALTMANYLACLTAADSHDAVAHARLSELQRSMVTLEQLDMRFTGWIGALDLDALEAHSALARVHSYPLRRAQHHAQHFMPFEQEMLASALGVSGGTAWRKLHTRVTSQLSVELMHNGHTTQVPMSVLRNYAYDPDRNLRQHAYEAELQAWQHAAAPLAAALNGIKGEVNVLSQRRGWASPLDETLFINSIDRATFHAMIEATREAFPDLRRYLRAKARVIGVEQLAWYDLFAPIGISTKTWDYLTATAFIVEQFGSYSDRLSDFAARAFREHWIDSAPRPGKRGGAFSERLRRGESRILANYQPSFVSVIIIAHELGHAYHEFNLIDRTALQSRIPETLAETASIFCETIVRHAALQHADRQEQIAILDSALQSSAQRALSTLSGFVFDQRVFEQRELRELSIDELCG